MEESRKNRKVTIKDIAKEAGVSTAAVSLILNNRPCRITEEKKNLVKEIAKKRHYVVNQAAKSMVTSKSRMLALILPDIENTFFSSLAKQIENRCRKEGYSLIIASSDDIGRNDRKLLRTLESQGVDGIFFIMSSESYEQEAELVQELSLLTMPYVQVDRTLKNLDCSRVRFDHEKGGYMAVKYLLGQGHREIACVYKDDKTGNAHSRLDGYLKAMKEYNVPIKEAYLQKGNYHLESGYEAAKQILKTGATAAFVCNDMMTLGFLKKLYEEGKRVPDDFSIVSYDDSLKNYLLEIELTTVAQDIGMLAECSCRLMFEALAKEGELDEAGTDNQKEISSEIVLEPQLRIRKSVRTLE